MITLLARNANKHITSSYLTMVEVRYDKNSITYKLHSNRISFPIIPTRFKDQVSTFLAFTYIIIDILMKTMNKSFT